MPAKRRKEKHWSFGKLWEITIVNRSKEDEEIMKAWKLVSGIISIILFVLVSLQSCAVGLGNTISSNGGVWGKRRNYRSRHDAVRWNCIHCYQEKCRKRRKYRIAGSVWDRRINWFFLGRKFYGFEDMGRVVRR